MAETAAHLVDHVGAQLDLGFGDQDQQSMDGRRIMSGAIALLPGEPNLYGVLETHLPRNLIGK